MKKKCIWLLLLFIILLVSGCVPSPTTSRPELGKEFSLALGRSATISDQDLQIKFARIISDSRCPQGATCIWAGEASSLIEITHAGTVNKLVLTQPGPVAEFIGYHIEFNLTPYPQLGKKIETGDYRLQLKVNKNED